MGEHWHSRQDEILFCFEGEGLFIVDDVEHRVVPGTTVFAGRWVRHKIVNTGKVDFKMTWTFLPPGLHEFAAAIGRPRRTGDPAPEPFARPLACEVTAPASAPLGAAASLVGYMRTGITVGAGGTGSA